MIAVTHRGRLKLSACLAFISTKHTTARNTFRKYIESEFREQRLLFSLTFLVLQYRPLRSIQHFKVWAIEVQAPERLQGFYRHFRGSETGSKTLHLSIGVSFLRGQHDKYLYIHIAKAFAVCNLTVQNESSANQNEERKIQL